jgi:hypothetical protein
VSSTSRWKEHVWEGGTCEEPGLRTCSGLGTCAGLGMKKRRAEKGMTRLSQAADAFSPAVDRRSWLYGEADRGWV